MINAQSNARHPQSLTVPCRAVKVHTKAFTHGAFTQTHFDTQTL